MNISRNILRSVYIAVCGVLFLHASDSRGVGEVPNEFTLSGQLYNSTTGIDPLLDPSILMQVQILDPTKACILYDEQQTISTLTTEGTFNLQIGSLTGAGKRTGGSDPGNSMVTVFQNFVAMSATCAGNTYTPTAGDLRYIRITVTPSTFGVADTLSPDITLGSVPMALVAERAENLQGLSRAQVLQLATVPDLIQVNLETVFSVANYPKLLTLLGGTSTAFVQSSATAGAPLPSLAAAPGSPTTGNIWYNSSTNSIQYYNGTVVHTVGTVSGTLTALTGDVSASGTGSVAATVNAVGGSTAANVNAATVLANASTDLNTVSTIVKRDASGNFSAGAASLGSTILRDAGVNTVTVAAPAAVASYTLHLPAAQGASTEFLVNDGFGNLSWSSDRLIAATSFAGDVSGSYTTTSVDKIKGVGVAPPALAGQVLRYDGANITPNFVGMGDLRSTVTGATALAATCGADQTLTYNTAMDNLACTNIAIASTAVSGIDTEYFKNGGNSFAAAASIGTADANDLTLVTSGAARMTVLAGGNVGIGDPAPTYPLAVAGDINSSTALYVGGVQVCTSLGCTAVSDRRLKQCVAPLVSPLDKILRLEGVSYRWKDEDKFGKSEHIGFIAQEVEKVFPEVIVTDSRTGFKSVAYDHLVAPIVEAIKALVAQRTQDEARLDAENARLKAQIAGYSAEVSALKTYLCAHDPSAPFCH